MATFFFCGIGGIGMSAIALYLKNTGHIVMGSDRSFDLQNANAVQNNLINSGIILYPQDGSGVTSDIDYFIVTRAVEDSIPDIKRAVELGLTIKKRPEILAEIFHSFKGIAVGGTCGKTSITAMIGHILYKNKFSPTMINGGISLNTYNNTPCSNLIFGMGDHLVIEADESDASIQKYNAFISVVSNISLDHFELDEIRPLFEDFLNRTKHGIVINADCFETKKLHLTHPNIIRFSTNGNQADLMATDITPLDGGISFRLNGDWTTLPMIGTHNVANALAAIGAALHAGIPISSSLKALNTFKGTRRRLQKIGEENNIVVYDDYAHNPEKIRAALSALKPYGGHIFAIYQPHGFAPMRLMKDDFIRILNDIMDDNLTLIMPDIYYVGGTVAKDISSEDVITPLSKMGKKALYIPNRTDILTYLTGIVKPNDKIIVMGARDDSLSDFAQEIFKTLQGA
ncbi:MAG: UDP-N-acetylmuramate--alanine ligase [Alphaproteobacteria bacterium]|nr:UDP-N-acetylmuramate--alanine ligase [Alphaproteobacteria bacterium]